MKQPLQCTDNIADNMKLDLSLDNKLSGIEELNPTSQK